MTLEQLLARLRAALEADVERGFQIGDLVNQLKLEYRMRVKDVASRLGASRQRLSEMRRTAAAFPSTDRGYAVDFHFFTLSARAARRLGMTPQGVLREVIRHGLQSTRHATAFLAAKVRERERLATASAPRTVVEDGRAIDRCHHADFRVIVPRLAARSVKLVIADPPYGQYGRNKSGRPTTTAATKQHCDDLTAVAAIQLMTEMFSGFASKMTVDGCLVLFRPGGCADPAWLMGAADKYGWDCRHAVTWDKGGTKLGNPRDPYSFSTERLLVFAQRGGDLQNHDGSSRSDVIRIPPIRPRYADGRRHHLFEKPAALCEFLVNKHSDPGDLVVEPFGGTGPVSAAAARLGRRWLYCETNRENFALGSARLAEASATRQAAG